MIPWTVTAILLGLLPTAPAAPRPGTAPARPVAPPPRSHAELDALHARLGHRDAAVRRAACESIRRAAPEQRSLYLSRLTRHAFQRYTEKQRLQLTQAGVVLPGPSGWFNIPKLKMGEKSPADVDMLAALIARPAPQDFPRQAAYVRALETLCTLRALAGFRDLRVAEPVVRFAFNPYGITYRWEVIRAIRGLGGYAVPALLKLSRLRVYSWKKQRNKFLLRRFAHHLLTTMQQANAQQALAMADRPLQLILLKTYGRFRDADAVEALITLTDHEEAELRLAARAALAQYFVGKAPKARVKRLKLPGGQESEHLQKLYFSYRERAIHEVRQALERLTSGRYDRSIPGRELVRMLFAEQDRLRRTRWTRQLTETMAQYAAGKKVEALRLATEILRHEPLLEGRHRLFPMFAERADALTLAGRLSEAATLLERAALLLAGAPSTPRGRQRRATLADATYLRALLQEARGKPLEAIALHRQALILWDAHPGAQVALMHLAPEPRTDSTLLWALVLLAALGAPGLLLLVQLLIRLRGQRSPEDGP